MIGTRVGRLEALIRDVVQAYTGTLQHLESDRFTVVFGVPQAQEDHTQRALLAALTLQQQWPTFAAECASSPATPPALRLGVHTGQVVVSASRDAPERVLTVVGEVLLLADLLAQHAVSGTILASAATSHFASAVATLEALPLLQLAAQAEPMVVYRVHPSTGRSSALVPPRERFRSRFVGRQAELAALLTGVARARHGQGHVIGVVAEAGMGKSRLLAEFRRQMTTQAITYLAGRCQSYGQTMPYLPLRTLVQQQCAIDDTDDAATCAVRLRMRLQELRLAPDDWAPWLLHLLGFPDETDHVVEMSPQARRARTFAALHQLLLASSQQQPLVVEVENLHWIDATSEAYLTALCERIVNASVLLVVTYRPGYLPPWQASSLAMQLPLTPLSSRHSQDIVRGMLGRRRLAASVFQQIVARAHGNPFFLEELALAVREHETGTFAGTVPSTIQAVLASRIDRLPPDAKRLLQAAAVIGPEVSLSLLRALVALPEAAFHESLRHLQAAEFLYETRLIPELVYTFKHILTRETAYQALLKSTRQYYHQQVAQMLAERFPEIAESQPALLAHHYTAAGLTEQAVDTWQRAGEHALLQSAYVEAIAHLTTGLDLLMTLPDTATRRQQCLTLHLTLGPALLATRGQADPEVERVYTQARALCQQVGETPQLFWTLMGLRRYYVGRGELHVARELGEQCLALSHTLHDPMLRVEAHYDLSNTLFWSGECVLARTHLEQGIAMYDPSHHHTYMMQSGFDPGVGFRIVSSLVLTILGYPDQALQQSHASITLTQELSHPYSLAIALMFAALFHQLRREAQRVQERAEATITLSSEQGLAQYLGMGIGTILRGWALVEQGQEEEGMAQMLQGLATYSTMGVQTSHPYLLTLLAEKYGETGQAEAGARVLGEALTLTDTHGLRLWEPELYRLKGELLLGQAVADESQAEGYFRQALATSRRQQAKIWELRVAMSLSRLWRQQGKRTEARELLAPIYGWFTEGFDTADLQDAKALLEALA